MTTDQSDGVHGVDGSARVFSKRKKPENAGARRGALYELFVLGELMGGEPLYGYLLHEILSDILGPFRQMSWGALYPLLRRLEQEGFIEPGEAAAASQDTDTITRGSAGGSSSGRSRQRNSYRITAAGRERFYALLLEPGAYNADYPNLFTIKLNYFGHIAPEQQLDILRHHRRYLRTENDYLHELRHLVASEAEIPENERTHIRRMLSYRLSGVEAQLLWVDGEIARLAGGSRGGDSRVGGPHAAAEEGR